MYGVVQWFQAGSKYIRASVVGASPEPHRKPPDLESLGRKLIYQNLL